MIKVKKDWFKTSYDKTLANITLDDKEAHDEAKKQVDFIIKYLKPKKSDLILDLPCGRGRHLVLLAKKGYKVQGIDISKACIEGAKRKITSKIKKNINFTIGDMSNLKKYYYKFDLILNIFTSFGFYPTDKQNEKVMREMIRALKPNGRLCFLGIIERENLLKRFKPKMWGEYPDCFILTKGEYNKKTKYNSAEWIAIMKKDKSIRRYSHSVRLYSKNEFHNLMKKYGLKNINVWGGIDGSRYNIKTSHHPVYIGTKS